ncbi:MAG: hypothetical protein P1V97_27770, partial [Planctomycetota bacterium]|nr:hypothetical protein [Planctomycetota bacterium]
EVPSSLQAKLGSMVAPSALTGSVVAIGGIIVKLKLMGLGALTVALGLGAWLFVENGANSPNNDSRERDRTQGLLNLKEENRSLKKRLSRLEGEARDPKTSRKPRPLDSQDEVAKLNEAFLAIKAKNKKLRNQIVDLKAELPEDSPRSLVANYVRLTNQAELEMKKLSEEEKKKYEAKMTPIILPIIMKLAGQSAAVADSILDALRDPDQERKDLLTGLLPVIFMSQKLEGEKRDRFNKRVIDLTLDSSVELTVRERLLSELQLDGDLKSEGARELADALIEIVNDKKSPFREDAVTKLAKLPYENAQRVVMNLVSDRSETAGLRSIAFIYGNCYEKPGGEALSLQLMRDPTTDMRRVAYEFSGSIKSPSDQVRRHLEDALVSEQEKELLSNILDSLEKLGTQQTVERLQGLIDDSSRALPFRNQAKKCRDAIQSRLKK